MNLLIVGRRVAVVSSVVAALLAAGYAASEHHTAQALQAQLRAAQEESAAQYDRTSDGSNEDNRGGPFADVPADHWAYAAVDDDTLPKVRQAARDFLQENKPSAKAEGVFTLALRPGNLYIAGVDASDGGQRRTVDLLVRLYTKRNGGQYWRAESLGADRAAALMDRLSEETAPAGSAYDADDASSDNSNGQ